MSDSLIIYNNKVVCPRCDGNGFLYKATLKPIDKIIVMCDECEAVWPISISPIRSTNFKDFTIYIQSLGYRYEDVELINIDYFWHTIV